MTEQSKSIAGDPTFDRDAEEGAFTETFKILANELGDDVFRRFDAPKERFAGGFSVSAYEAVGVGVGFAPEKVSTTKLKDRVKAMWRDPEFINNSGSGVRASSRIPKIIPYGRKMFHKK